MFTLPRDDPSARGLAHALRHGGRGEPVAGHGAFRALVVGTRPAARSGRRCSGAVFLAWTQVLTWTAYGLPGLRIIVAVLWLAALDAVVILAVQLEVPEPRLVAMLAPQLPLAYLAACFVVARARRGDVPDWRGAFARTSRIAPCPVASAGPVSLRRCARRCGSSGGSRAGCCRRSSASCCRSSWACSTSRATSRPCSSSSRSWACCSPRPSWPASRQRPRAGRVRTGAIPSGVTLTATRPLTSAALVAAKLQAAIWSTLAAWLLVLVAVPLALALTGTWPVVADGVDGGRSKSSEGRARS